MDERTGERGSGDTALGTFAGAVDAACAPLRPLMDALSGALDRAGLLRPGARLMAAVSGGADSVALLLALAALSREQGLCASACHVQHGLRGVASDGDEAFVRALCARMGVPLAVKRAALAGGMEDAGVETRARAERLRLFDMAMREGGIDALLLAHHRDDQAETTLMRLMRGAGAEGLGGMRERVPFSRGAALRPFLALPKRALVSALEAAGLPHREDESNQRPLTPRNALRLDVLPKLEALCPGASARIAEAAEALRADDDCLSAMAREVFGRALTDYPPVLALRRDALLGCPQAVARRAVRRLYALGLERAGLCPGERALGHGDTLRLLALASAPRGAAANLPCGLAALGGSALVYLVRQGGAPLAAWEPPAPQAVTAGAGTYRLPGALLTLSPCGPREAPPGDARSVILPPALVEAGLRLRAPLKGDRMRPLGAAGGKPLRRLMTDRRVDAPWRAALPVLALCSDVLWVPGILTSERLRAPEDTTDCYRLALSGRPLYLPTSTKE